MNCSGKDKKYDWSSRLAGKTSRAFMQTYSRRTDIWREVRQIGLKKRDASRRNSKRVWDAVRIWRWILWRVLSSKNI